MKFLEMNEGGTAIDNRLKYEEENKARRYHDEKRTKKNISGGRDIENRHGMPEE